MPMNIVQGNEINNIYRQTTRKMIDDAHAAIGALTFNDLFRGARTLTRVGTVRVDMQGTFNLNGNTWSNIQVQVNDIGGNSTIAHVLLSHQCQGVTNVANQRGVAQSVRSALEQSLDKKWTYQVTGTLP